MRRLKGSMTVEAAYVAPIVFMVFVMIIYSTFYFHDKNIIKGCLYETEAIIGQKERIERMEETENRRAYFEERLGNKLILLSLTSFETKEVDEGVMLNVSASKGAMTVSAQGFTRVMKPEQYIRKVRNVERIIQEK